MQLTSYNCCYFVLSLFIKVCGCNRIAAISPWLQRNQQDKIKSVKFSEQFFNSWKGRRRGGTGCCCCFFFFKAAFRVRRDKIQSFPSLRPLLPPPFPFFFCCCLMALSICPASLLLSLYYAWTQWTSLFPCSYCHGREDERLGSHSTRSSLHVWMNASLPPITPAHIYYSICHVGASFCVWCFTSVRPAVKLKKHLHKRPEHVCVCVCAILWRGIQYVKDSYQCTNMARLHLMGRQCGKCIIHIDSGRKESVTNRPASQITINTAGKH